MKLRSREINSNEKMAEPLPVDAGGFSDAQDRVTIEVTDLKDNKTFTSNINIDIFTLNKDIDPRLWLTKFSFLAEAYGWKDGQILKNVVFFLDPSLWGWFKDKISDKTIVDLESFKAQFLKLVEISGNEFLKRLDLDQRKLKEGENLLTYLMDIRRLCNIIDPKMVVKSVVYHILKGLPSRMTENLLSKDFTSVDDLETKLKRRESERVMKDRLYGGTTTRTTTENVRTNQDHRERRFVNNDVRIRQGPVRRQNVESPRFRRRPLTEVTCWNCHEKGHLCYNCPNGKVTSDSFQGTAPLN